MPTVDSSKSDSTTSSIIRVINWIHCSLEWSLIARTLELYSSINSSYLTNDTVLIFLNLKSKSSLLIAFRTSRFRRNQGTKCCMFIFQALLLLDYKKTNNATTKGVAWNVLLCVALCFYLVLHSSRALIKCHNPWINKRKQRKCNCYVNLESDSAKAWQWDKKKGVEDPTPNITSKQRDNADSIA